MLKGRVLIIDDNEKLLLTLKEIISSHHECIDFYENLKKIALDFLTHAVFMTGGIFTKGTGDFLKLPGITHFEKPIDSKKFLSMIQNLVKINHLKDLSQAS